MKPYLIASALGLALLSASPIASARVDLNIGLGIPGLMYGAPPPVVYAAPPVYQAPPVVYDGGPGWRGDRRDWDHRRHDDHHDHGHRDYGRHDH